MCEGTRFTKEKYEASVEIAKEKGLPILKHHLLPRTKGFTLLASQIKGKQGHVSWVTKRQKENCCYPRVQEASL